MKTAAIKWGIRGAMPALFLWIVLIVMFISVPWSPLHESVRIVMVVITKPLVWFWESLGMRDEYAEDRLVVPFYVSSLLYFPCIGFLVGMGLGKLRGKI